MSLTNTEKKKRAFKPAFKMRTLFNYWELNLADSYLCHSCGKWKTCISGNQVSLKNAYSSIAAALFYKVNF